MTGANSRIAKVNIAGDAGGGKGAAGVELGVDPVGAHHDVFTRGDRDFDGVYGCLFDEKIDRVIAAIKADLDAVGGFHIAKAHSPFKTRRDQQSVIVAARRAACRSVLDIGFDRTCNQRAVQPFDGVGVEDDRGGVGVQRAIEDDRGNGRRRA